MSFALQLVYKVGIIALCVAVCVAIMAGLGTFINIIFGEIDVAFDGNVSAALQKGRELANIFINPVIFNACISLWLAAFPLSIGYSMGMYIYKLLDL